MPARHQEEKAKARRAVAPVLVCAAVGLVAFGVLGWIAPARAYTTAAYTIQSPGRMIEDGNYLWVSGGTATRTIKRFNKTSNSVDKTCTLGRTDVSPDALVKMGNYIYATDINETGQITNDSQSTLVKIDVNSVAADCGATYSVVSVPGSSGPQDAFRPYAITTDGTSLYLLSRYKSRPDAGITKYWRDCLRVYKADSNGVGLMAADAYNVNGADTCFTASNGYFTEKHNGVKITVSGTAVWINYHDRWEDTMDSWHDYAVSDGFNTGNLSRIRTCNGAGIDNTEMTAMTLVGSAFHLSGLHNGYYTNFIKRDPVTCTDAVFQHYNYLGKAAATDGTDSWFTTEDDTPDYIGLGMYDGVRYYRAMRDTNYTQPKDLIKNNYLFYVLQNGGTLLRYDFTDESGLANPTPTVTVQSRSATVAWTTNKNADAQLQWGTTTEYLGGTIIADTFPNYTTSHSINTGANSLAPGTLYYYKVRSCNGMKCVSATGSFTTTALQNPTVTISNPTTLLKYFTNVVSLDGTAGDVDGHLDLLQYRYCHQHSACPTGNWTNITLPTTNPGPWGPVNFNILPATTYGAYRIEVLATDNNGLIRLAYVDIWRYAMPVITESHTEGLVVGTPAFTASGTITDADNNIAGGVNGPKVYLTNSVIGDEVLQTISMTPNPPNQSLSWTSGLTLAQGTNTILVVAQDITANVAYLTRTIYLNANPPVVTITNHTDNEIVTVPTINFSGDADDPDDNITAPMTSVLTHPDGTNHNVSITPTPSLPRQNLTSWASANATLEAGINTFVVTATDVAGHTGTATIHIDYRIPDFTLTVTPATQTKNQGDIVTYNYTVAALNGWNTAVTVTVPVRDNYPANRMAINPTTTPTCPVGSFPCNGTIVLNPYDVNPALSPFNMVASGTGGSTTHTANFELILNAGPDWRFEPTSQTVSQQQGTTPAGFDLILKREGTQPYPYDVLLSRVQITYSGSASPTAAQRCVGADPCMFSTETLPGTAVDVPSTNEYWVTPKANASVGTWTFLIRGVGQPPDPLTRTHEFPATLVITDGPDFSMTSSDPTETINAGTNAVFPIQLTQTVPVYDEFVDLSKDVVVNMPTGGNENHLTFNFTNAHRQVSPHGAGSGDLTIATNSAITPGTWVVRIKGVGVADSPHREKTLNLTININAPDFSIDAYKEGASPIEEVTVAQGTEAVWDVKLDSVNNWGGNVDLTIPSPPAAFSGVYSFQPTPANVPASNSVTAKLRINTTTIPAGTYTFTARGTMAAPPNNVKNDPDLRLIVTDGPDWNFTPPPLPSPPVPSEQNGLPGNTVSYTLNLQETVVDYTSNVDVNLVEVVDTSTGLITTKVHLTTSPPPDLPAVVLPGDKAGSPATKQVRLAIDADAPLHRYSIQFRGVGQDAAFHRTHLVVVYLNVIDVDFLPHVTPVTSYTRPAGVLGTANPTLRIEDLPSGNGVVDYTWDIATVALDRITPSDPGTIGASVVAANPPGKFVASENWSTVDAGYITITWNAATPVGTYNLIFKATGSDPAPVKEHEFTITLNIVAAPPVISNIDCTAGTDRITVTWDTNAPANGTLYYGASLPPSTAQTEGAGDVIDHSVTATGLTSGTAYRYQVESVNSAGSSGRQPATAGTCTTTTQVDLEDPIVEWRNPLNTDPVTGTIPLRAYAHDNFAVNKVEMRIDGNLIHTDSTPAQWPAVDEWGTPTWDSTTVSNGGHTLNATATDTSGRVASHLIGITVSNAVAAPICSAFRYQVSGQDISIWWTTNVSSNSVVYYCREGSGTGTCGNCPLPPGAPAGSGYCTKYTGSGDTTDHYVHLAGLVIGRYHFMAESCASGTCGQCRKD